MSEQLYRATLEGPVPLTPEEVIEYWANESAQAALVLPRAKEAKRLQINKWREEANKGTFPHNGFVFSCDTLSRNDIDSVAGCISLTGSFPPGFSYYWRSADNTNMSMTSVPEFKAFYASMGAQGTENFDRSQALKATLEACTTVEQVNAIQW